MWRMHRARLLPFTLSGDHKAEKLDLFRTALRLRDVEGQRIYDLPEFGFPAGRVAVGRADVLVQHDSRAGTWQL